MKKAISGVDFLGKSQALPIRVGSDFEVLDFKSNHADKKRHDIFSICWIKAIFIRNIPKEVHCPASVER